MRLAEENRPADRSIDVLADISKEAGFSAIGAIQQKQESAAASSSAVAPGAPAAAAAGVTAPVSGASSPGLPSLPNPRLTVDPSTARVVYEYFNTTGVLTNSIPSQQQLEAYRLAAASGGEKPAPASEGT